MLHRAIHSLAPLCAEILVSVPFCGETPSTPADVSTVSVRDQRPDEGPLIGLWTTLREASEPIALVVAGDMPFMRTAVLALVVEALENSEASVACLADAEAPRPLPCAFRVGEREKLQGLIAAGERRLRALISEFPLVVVPQERWRALDPAGGSLRDIDRPVDLAEAGD
jgi:molybdopterin-guanine dinucleotide biosynthesis protein A